MSNNEDINPKTGKPKRRHSESTLMKMSEKRRSRNVQPRTGTTKKAFNLYQQLKKDYKGHKNEKKIIDWIEENKHLLNNTSDETRNELGILTDFHLQYPGIYELKIGSVLYDNNLEEKMEFSLDPFDIISEGMDCELE